MLSIMSSIKALSTTHRTVLTKRDIEVRRQARQLIIEPLLHKIGSCHVDVRLDNYFGTFQTTGEAFLDPAVRSNAIEFEEVPFFTRPFYVQPGTFLLGQTLEFIALPNNIVASLDGRSSLGRRGLVVHATAGWIDPGYTGHITLEFANLGVMPLALYPGMRVGRLVFMETSETEIYEGQFQNQLRIQEPKVDVDCMKIAAYAHTVRKSQNQ